MKKVKKALILVLCAILLVVGSVMGTLAYLKVQTQEVKNTFTVGKINVGTVGQDGKVINGMNEAKVNEYGQKLDADGTVDADNQNLHARVIENTYKLIPGHNYVKDPTVHILGGSEACWLFVSIENEIVAIEKADEQGKEATTIAGQMKANGFEKLYNNSNIYYMTTTTQATAENETKDYVVFKSFTIADDADVSGYAGKTIKLNAYLVQADGFSTAQSAWEATFGANN